MLTKNTCIQIDMLVYPGNPKGKPYLLCCGILLIFLSNWIDYNSRCYYSSQSVYRNIIVLLLNSVDLPWESLIPAPQSLHTRVLISLRTRALISLCTSSYFLVHKWAPISLCTWSPNSLRTSLWNLCGLAPQEYALHTQRIDLSKMIDLAPSPFSL